MKKSAIIKFLLILFPLLFFGCVEEEQIENTPMGNFEALWKILDEQYCFFEYKQIDWDEIYSTYKPQINSQMDEDELFSVLSNMLTELRDGHVNLNSDSHFFSYQGWAAGSPHNFNEEILHKYLKGNYSTIGGLIYKILPNSIGYIYIDSFSHNITYSELYEILQQFSSCKGIILDVRDNGGGSITNSTRIASCFTNKKVLTGYLQHKTGKGRNEFSTPKAIYLEPSGKYQWLKPVAVLANRYTYSAANNFVNIMSCLPHTITVGDISGGGSGLPFSSELPNGWSVRFSTSPLYDAEMNHIEFGITPDIKVDMTEADEKRGKDTIIEAACNSILNH